MTGNIDGISARGLRGWLHVPDAREPVEVHLTVDGEAVATTVLDRRRPDVERRFGAERPLGFRFDLPDAGCRATLGVVHVASGFDFHASRWRFCEHAAAAVVEHEDALGRLFFAQYYRHRHGLENLSNEGAFRHYVENGVFRGLDPCPWFSDDYFREHHGGLLNDCDPPVIAYIRHQQRHDIRPSGLFDPAHYGKRYVDLQGRRLLEHYVGHGHAEGRHPIERRLPDPVLEEIAEMIEIEPSITRVRTDPRSIVRHALPIAANYIPRLIRRRFGSGIVAVVCTSAVESADDVSMHLLSALRETHGDERVLLIVTDSRATDVTVGTKGGANVIHLDDECDFIREDIRVDTLHDIIGLLAPRMIVNVDSSAAWGMYRKFGLQMAAEMELNAHVSRFERAADERVGNAFDYLAELLGVLSYVVCASRAIVERIQDLHGLSEPERNKLHTVYTPVGEGERLLATTMDAGVDRRALPVLWTDSLSERARPERLLEIAAAMPARRFVVRGPIGDSPHAIRIMGGGLQNIDYRDAPVDLDALDVGEYALVLNTSEDDTLSRTLVRIAGLGIPIVTPTGGGTAELFGDDIGWTVGPDATVLDYVTRISSALVQTRLTEEKLRRGRARFAQRHTRRAFLRRLAEIGVLDTGDDRGSASSEYVAAA